MPRESLIDKEGQRGISPVIGAVLLVGILTVGYSIYLVSYVPAQESQAEYQHDQKMRQEMEDLKAAIVDTAQSGNQRSPTLQLGKSYPTPPLAPPRPPISGGLSAEKHGNVTLANAKAVSNETSDFWNGGSQTYPNRLVSYHAKYQYQDSPRLRYEHGLVATDYQSDDILRSRSSVIRGSTITLTTLSAEPRISASQKQSLSITPISPASSTVAIQNTSDPIKIELNTTLAKSVWEKSLESELVANGGNVESLSYTDRPGKPNIVSITLKKGETYELQMGRAAIGQAGKKTEEAYLTYDERLPGEVSPGENVTGKIVARDKYNNPVPGTKLTANLQGPGKVTLLDERTDSEGEMRIKYSAPDSASNQEAEIEVKTASGAATADLAIDQELEIEDDDNEEDEDKIGETTELRMANPGTQRGVSCNTELTECTVDISKTSSVDLGYKTNPSVKGVDVDTFVKPGPALTAPSRTSTDQNGVARTALKAWETGSTTVTGIAGEAHKQTRFVFEKDGGNIQPAVTDLSVGAEFKSSSYSSAAKLGFDYRLRDSDGFDRIKFKAIPKNSRGKACPEQSDYKTSKDGFLSLEVGLQNNDPGTSDDCGTTHLKLVVQTVEKTDCNRFGNDCQIETKTFEETFGDTSSYFGGNNVKQEFPYNWVGDKHKREEDYSSE